MDRPLVSLLMCSFNREKFIREAIESVLKSTYANFELIIVDNCSEDETFEIIKSFKKSDSRIKVYQNETNIGQFPNRNRAATYASGKYIKYIDSDDMIYPHGLQLMVEAMEKFPAAGLGLCYYFKNKRINPRFLPLILTSQESYMTHFLGGGLLFPGPTFTIYRREIFNTLNGFDDSFGISSDTHFNLKIAAISPVVVFSSDAVFWRQHNGQLTAKQNELNIMLERHRVNQDILRAKYCPLDKSQIQLVKKSLKTITARRLILDYLLAFKITPFLLAKRQFNYSFLDLLSSLIPLRWFRHAKLNEN